MVMSEITKSERFILFEVEYYYPAGGSGNEHSRHADLESAVKVGEDISGSTCYFQILDLKTGQWDPHLTDCEGENQ